MSIAQSTVMVSRIHVNCAIATRWHVAAVQADYPYCRKVATKPFVKSCVGLTIRSLANEQKASEVWED